MTLDKTRNGHITHRATEEMVTMLEGIRDAIQKDSGVRPSRSQVVELAIRELAQKKRVCGRVR